MKMTVTSAQRTFTATLRNDSFSRIIFSCCTCIRDSDIPRSGQPFEYSAGAETFAPLRASKQQGSQSAPPIPQPCMPRPTRQTDTQGATTDSPETNKCRPRCPTRTDTPHTSNDTRARTPILGGGLVTLRFRYSSSRLRSHPNPDIPGVGRISIR